jgi:hypothetical protein
MSRRLLRHVTFVTRFGHLMTEKTGHRCLAQIAGLEFRQCQLVFREDVHRGSLEWLAALVFDVEGTVGYLGVADVLEHSCHVVVDRHRELAAGRIDRE